MSTKRQTLSEQDIQCLGHLRRVLPFLDKLRDVGCERDTAGNRLLHFDDYVKLVLLYTWNPLIVSVRDLQRTLALKNVAKTLGVKRFSMGSFSEAPAVFEPERLKEVIAELAGELRPLPRNPQLKDLQQALTLVDGTILRALPRLARAAAEGTQYIGARDGTKRYGWKLHLQLDLDTFSPRRIDRTGALGSGEAKEEAVLKRHLEPDRCYVIDGGYGHGQTFDAIVDAASSYVGRIRTCSAVTVLEERPLSQEALDANVVRDALVTWTGKHPLRLVGVQITPRPARGGRDNQGDLLLIATNMLTLPAELVALIYLQRYSIELFFRFFKSLLGLRHLLSQRPEGIDIQVYCAVIVCLLINLMTGRKPCKAMVSMIGFYLIGWADEEELLAFLNKPDNTGVKKRAKEELWKKLGF